MEIILLSNCSLDIEKYVKLKISVFISPSKSLICSPWVAYDYVWDYQHMSFIADPLIIPFWCIVWWNKEAKLQQFVHLFIPHATVSLHDIKLYLYINIFSCYCINSCITTSKFSIEKLASKSYLWNSKFVSVIRV